MCSLSESATYRSAKEQLLRKLSEKKGNFLLEKLYDCSVQLSFKKDVHDSCSAMSLVNVTGFRVNDRKLTLHKQLFVSLKYFCP